MNSDIYKPKRHLKNEIYSLVLVMLAPVGIAIVFPYEYIGWRSSEAADAVARENSVSSCAFIRLSEDGEAKAVAATRSSMRTSSEGFLGGRIRANLSMSEIPEETGDIADISDRCGVKPLGIVKTRVLPRPPSLAAPKAEKLPDSPLAPEGKEASPPEKKKFDLLEIDESANML